MYIAQRLELLARLADYIRSDEADWMYAKELASRENAWFTPEFIDRQVQEISTRYLSIPAINEWMEQNQVSGSVQTPRNTGIIMAGNIPMAGFHDFLACFVSGHRQTIKSSSKDAVLIPHLLRKMTEWNPDMADWVNFAPMLKGCDAYIATGSNNSARYFDYYFSKYPHIIRRNRTSAAILHGDETAAELAALADDVYLYFGLGCRNITKLYVPWDYNFEDLLTAWRKYNYLFDHNKYKNNYDYQLAILIINSKYYMTNGSILLLENTGFFTPVGVVHYEYYDDRQLAEDELQRAESIQAIGGKGFLPFGTLQSPGLSDFADGVNTLQFLRDL